MARHSRMLHFATGNGTDDVTLYTTLGDVVDPSLINEDQTTGGISLYTTGADTGYPALRMQDGGTTVYAPLVDPASMSATNLKVQHNNTNYAVGEVSPCAPVGVCLVQSSDGAGTWARIDGDGNPITTNLDFDKISPWCDIHDVTVDGQAMVYIPSFYVKTGTLSSGVYSGKKYWLISKNELAGYHLHPAFMYNNIKKDGIYIAKYISYNSGNNVPGSASEKTMWGGISPGNCRTYINYRNDGSSSGAKAGWHLWTIYELAVIQYLALIELGTPDVQAAIANGTSSNITGRTPAQYRGINDAWYGYPPIVDGLKYFGQGSRIYMFSNRNDGTYVNNIQIVNADSTTLRVKLWITGVADEKGLNYDMGDVFVPISTNSDQSQGTFADISFNEINVENQWTFTLAGGWFGRGISECGLFHYHPCLGENMTNDQVTSRMAKYDI